MLTASLSNSLDVLYDLFKRDYFSEQKVLQKQLIAVPHLSMAAFLTRRLAEDSPHQIACGYTIGTLEEEMFQKEEGNILLFGFSTLQKSSFDFFRGSSGMCRGYFLSPCMMYWEDIVSDKKARFIQQKVAENATPRVQERLQELLFDRHPLLANLGHDGRAFFSLLQESGIEIEEHYEEKAGTSSLETLQNDLLQLEQSQPLSSADTTIQLHSCPTLLSEIEVLFERIQEHVAGKALDVGDIVVAVPDIERYRPFIDAVFSSQKSPFSYQILHRTIDETKHSFLAQFVKLLTLGQKRFSKDALLQLLEIEPFCMKCKIPYEEAAAIHETLRQSNFFHSVLNKLDLQKIYQQEGIQAHFVEEGHSIDHFIEAYLTSSIDATLAKSIGAFLKTLQELIQTFRLTFEKEELPLSEWAQFLQQLLLTFFEFTSKEKKSFEIILEAIELLFKGALAQKKNISFQAVQTAFREKVEELLQKRECFPRAEILFVPQEALPYPAKMVALLGMNEDKRKYRLIEAILSAKEKLMISFQGFSFEENAELFPAASVEALQLKAMTHSLMKRRKKRDPVVPSSFQIQIASPQEKIIDLQLLQSIAKNPLKTYFQHAFSISLYQEKEEEFSSLDYYLLKKQSLEMEKEAFLEQCEQHEKLPQNRIKTAYLEHFEELYSSYQESKSKLGEMKTLEYSIGNNQAVQVGDFLVTGRLETVFSQTLPVFSSMNESLLFQKWPELLLLALDNSQVELFSLKDKKSKKVELSNAKEHLYHFVEYAMECHTKPFLLLPEYVEDLLSEKPVLKVNQDPYVQLLYARMSEEEIQKIVHDSAEKAKVLFKGVLEHANV